MNYQVINTFLKVLDKNKRRLSQQQFRTLKGQAINGHVEEAKKGLGRLLRIS